MVLSEGAADGSDESGVGEIGEFAERNMDARYLLLTGSGNGQSADSAPALISR
jgi:hypothetical protein